MTLDHVELNGFARAGRTPEQGGSGYRGGSLRRATGRRPRGSTDAWGPHVGDPLRDGDGVALLRYITHPDVLVDPGIAVERWTLSPQGWARARRLLDEPWVGSIRRVVTSEEVKALDTAQLLAAHLGIVAERRAATGEIDRSATGFLPPDEFERLADACFADPTVNARGPIDRRRDQPGQGHYFTVDRSTGRPLHAWRPITGDRSQMPPRQSSAP